MKTELAILWIALGAPGLGQGSAATASTGTKTPQYEVVSIKPAKTGSNSNSWQTLRDGFQIRNMPLQSLVYDAYDIIMDSQVSGMPGWAETDPYDVDAKVDAETAESWKNLPYEERDKLEQPMLRALLADRCQFKAHEVTKEEPVYDLVIAKSGLKMKEAPTEQKGSMTMMYGKGYAITAHAATISVIVENLPESAGRLIVDKTGLGEKKFDFELKWTPDEQRAADPANAGPSLFTALEEQLGLKLVPSKGPVQVLVIDHMERPSAN